MSLVLAHRVDAVLFDVDDTLIDYLAARRRGIVDFVAELGVSVDEAVMYAEWLRLEELYYDRFLAGELDWIGQRRARLRDLLRWLGAAEPADDAESDHWFARIWAGCARAIELYPDVEPCLTRLADGSVSTGVVTNNVPQMTIVKLAAAGLDQRFPVVISVSDEIRGKPDPRIFLAGCAALGVPPERTMYVGDRLGTDAVGARDAGMIGVWLDRTNGAGRSGSGPVELPPGVIRIGSLGEL